ncbi:hypothetical protein BROUX41_003600 [Berkeleyomyces rouxiae]|uniref:uncharacterized protein n=1 Tax=Berkeleyomyces rouxiae TaxID=2035830 RepID=UPI003B7C959B
MFDDLHSTFARLRIASLQSHVLSKPGRLVQPRANPVRRQRHRVMLVQGGSRLQQPAFAKQRIIRVVS